MLTWHVGKLNDSLSNSGMHSATRWLRMGRLTKLTSRGIFNKRISLAQILEFSTIVNSQEVSILLHFSP